MKTEKQSFVLYHDIRGPLKLLNDEQRGKLFMAIIDYSEFGVQPEFQDAALDMAFAFVRNTLDRDRAAWEDKREKRVAAGSLGGLKRIENIRQREAIQANATFAKQNKQSVANQAVPVPVPDSVPVSVIKEKTPRARFVPPTLEEVKAYCKSRGSSVDPVRFLEYYQAGGWVDSKGQPVKSWKQKLLTWEHKEQKPREAGQTANLDWRKNERPVTPDDLVEYPPGSGQYRPRWEVDADG